MRQMEWSNLSGELLLSASTPGLELKGGLLITN